MSFSSQIGSGDPLGIVIAPTNCFDPHIHFSMRKIGTSEYIDPSRYMEDREMPAPGFSKPCDIYKMVIKVTISNCHMPLSLPD